MLLTETKTGMSVTNRSIITGETNTMHLDITVEQYRAWKGGELIQEVMPQLSADEREFLMTGITPFKGQGDDNSWETIFGGEKV